MIESVEDGQRCKKPEGQLVTDAIWEERLLME
jgi:hypothetical protein